MNNALLHHASQQATRTMVVFSTLFAFTLNALLPSAAVLAARTTKKRPAALAAAPRAAAATQNFNIGLRGYVDMHTHPMAHLGFGKKLLHGAPDVGSIIPKGSYAGNTEEFRAKHPWEALSSCAGDHGGWGTDNTTGDTMRAALINHGLDGDFAWKLPTEQNLHGDHHHPGWPEFKYWPHQTSKVHQQMWWEWIKRAHEGGLRVMVALSVNNQLLANALNGDSPKSDVASSNLQINEIKSFVKRHDDFMEVAYTPADLRRIVTANKLAVILGMEIDDFGGFGAQGQAFKLFPEAFQRIQVKNELQRVYNQGVRYLFPIHLTNNAFGGAAVYNPMFNFANKHNTGKYMNLQQAADASIKYDINFAGEGTALAVSLLPEALTIAGELVAPCINDVSCLPLGKVRCCSPALGIMKNAMARDGIWLTYQVTPKGHMNSLGLTPLGEYALQEMMKMGLLIDLDHMGAKSLNRSLELANGFKDGYPVNLGHNGLRQNTAAHPGTERNVNAETIRRVIKLKGMFGLGTSDLTTTQFIAEYRKVIDAVEGETDLYAALGVGTDANGMEPLPKGTPGLAPLSNVFYNTHNLQRQTMKDSTGKVVRTWDYTKEGVAHYGLMKEFMVDVKTQPNGQQVWNHLMNSAEYFAKMWEKCEKLSDK